MTARRSPKVLRRQQHASRPAFGYSRSGSECVRSWPIMRATRLNSSLKTFNVEFTRFGRGMSLDDTTLFGVHTRCHAVDHDLAYCGVENQRLKVISERTVEPSPMRFLFRSGHSLASPPRWKVEPSPTVWSTETRFSWNSVIVSPRGLMVSYCGFVFAWSLTWAGIQVVRDRGHPMLCARLVRRAHGE